LDTSGLERVVREFESGALNPIEAAQKFSTDILLPPPAPSSAMLLTSFLRVRGDKGEVVANKMIEAVRRTLDSTGTE